MAPKSAYEEDYKIVFAPFGTPIDIYVIRDRNGFSKGCAFVRYETVKSATDAIEALHDKYIMPGGFRTLVVTVADDRRSPHSGSGTDALGASGEWAHSLPPRHSCSGASESCSRSNNNSASLRGLTIPSRPIVSPGQMACASPVSPGASPPLMPGMPYLFCGGNPPQGTYVYYPYMSPPSVPGQQQHATAVSTATIAAKPPQHAFAVGSPVGACGSRYDPRVVVCTESPGGGVTAQGQPRAIARDAYEDGYMVEGGGGAVRNFGAIGPEEKGRRWAKQSVGPMGANLFVYYLPGSLTDEDLASAFAPFGEVLSAKVYYDRDTGESKGFGKILVSCITATHFLSDAVQQSSYKGRGGCLT